MAAVAADEDELAGGRQCSGVARGRPVTLPDEPATAGVDRGEDAGVVAPGFRDRAAELLLARLRLLGLRPGDEGLGARLAADVEHLCVRVVARGRPLAPTKRSGGEGIDRPCVRWGREERPRDDLQRRAVLAERRRGRLPDRVQPGGGDCVGHERAAIGERLRRRRVLLRPAALRDRLLGDAVERLAGLAVEQVIPASLAWLAQPVHELAVHRGVEEHDRAGRVVVPDVVVNFLEVPAVRAGLRVDRHDRAGEEVVTGSIGAAEVR